MKVLSDRWHPLRFHEKQQAYMHSKKRFNIVPAGRRSGKTEIGKRRLVRKALLSIKDDARYIAGAPTHAQSKRLFWRDLKKMVPRKLMLRDPSEGELSIELINGAIIWVTGLDKPERVEGPPIDHILLDEYGNMKEEVWTEHVRPGLADHEGTADLIGAPEGRNHYYDLWCDAQEQEWGCFTWPSSDILPPEEIEAAKQDLDPLTYSQEFNAKFETFQGLAYYQFSRDIHVGRVGYDLQRTLIFCFDFNVSPGVAVVVQEYPEFTAIIGEVHIPQNSTTPKVCRKLIQDWPHTGKAMAYGDATGGAKGSAKVEGSDWDLIRQYLKPKFPGLRFDVPSANPKERSRINAVNSRLLSASGRVGVRIDPACKFLIKDFEGVTIQDGTAGEINKSDPTLTHLTDALGYYIVRKWPVRKRILTSQVY